MTIARRTFTAGALALLLGHCGGSVESAAAHGPDGGVDGAAGGDGGLGDSGACEGTAGQNGAPGLPAEHRATAAACPRTPVTPVPDGGLASCNADQDCEGDAGGAFEAMHCAEHVCGYDTCLTDADCATGSLCLCNADAGGGTRSPGNVCVPAACHVDADCGAGNECTPSRSYCADVSGFYCTSSQDTCVDPTRDCACGGNSCVYAPTVGHFACATSTCNG